MRRYLQSGSTHQPGRRHAENIEFATGRFRKSALELPMRRICEANTNVFATGLPQPAILGGRWDRCGGVVSNLVTPFVQAHGARRVDRFLAVRARTEQLAAPLSAEDQTVQSMPDASPTKWHLAHTTWFFETFLLRPHARDYRVFDPAYEYLFNSYYEAVGPRHPRPQRGMITRPGVGEILAYRRHVSDAMAALLTG